mgnify:CR=1 FL=1
MKAERLVIDSNVWIAALISPTGTARQLVDAVLDHDIDRLAFELPEAAAPLARLMLQKATSIIDEEGNIASTDERKSLLIGFADLRGSMAMAIGAIRAYLLTADKTFMTEFEEL